MGSYLLWGAALGSVWLTGLLLGVCCTGVWDVDDPLTSTWLVAFLPTADGVDKQGGRGLDSTRREKISASICSSDLGTIFTSALKKLLNYIYIV